MKEDLKISEVQQEVLVGILSIISLLGSLAGGKTSDVLGRKWTIALAAIVFQSGAATMALAPSFTVLMIGRLLTGVGIGFGVMIAPVYIAEISPSVARGSLTSFPDLYKYRNFARIYLELCFSWTTRTYKLEGHAWCGDPSISLYWMCPVCDP